MCLLCEGVGNPTVCAMDCSQSIAMKRSYLLLGMALCACDGGNESSAGDIVLEGDSAGITMIQSSPPYATWSVDPSPVLKIGVMDGSADYQFSNAAYVARLSDDRIVLFDGGSSEVRWYGSDGRFQARAGRRGRGPGEFQSVTSAVLTARDTLVLYDFRNQRVTWVSPGGLIARTRHIDLESSSRINLASLGGSDLLIAEERATFNFGESEFNYARDSVLVLVPSNSTDAVDTVLRLSGREAVTWVDYVDGRPIATQQMSLPFGERTLIGGIAGRPVVIRNGRDDLAFFDSRGDLTALARRSDVAPPRVSTLLREQFVTHAVERGMTMGMQESAIRSASEDRISLLAADRRVPAFDLVLSNPVEDRVWLRDFLPEWRRDEAREWTVHDATGRVVARVTTLPGLEVMHVASGNVVGVERDALGVEYVVVYALE